MASSSPFAAYDFLATGVVLIGADSRILYVNSAAETLIGMSGTLLTGHAFDNLFGHNTELVAALNAARETRETVTEHDLPVQANHHAAVPMSCTISVHEGHEWALVLELRPADQRLRIARQENIRAQQEASRELLRNLAHEIKNPLGGIRGAAQLLEHELSRESLREYTQVIIKEADRLQSLMERLLTPHRLPRLSPVNIHEVLERVRSLLLAETPHGIRIRRDYDVSLPEIRADSEQLIQAVLNIARNAVQAMNGKGELAFRTRAARQVTLNNRRHRLALRLDIIDDGPGIPEALREQVFFPLVSGREGGSGLGLPLAQTLVAQNKGVIEFESRPGHTVFSIYFPIETASNKS
ncbi:PAS domain-containing protein [Betaproteobacteria bacterium SCN2]|jgi:two-component system nitrogen regulation sensor histidine kinase GlnL|nr:PAS domain-containing protein [Betaproteobacteria bacterium SCN2]